MHHAAKAILDIGHSNAKVHKLIVNLLTEIVENIVASEKEVLVSDEYPASHFFGCYRDIVINYEPDTLSIRLFYDNHKLLYAYIAKDINSSEFHCDEEGNPSQLELKYITTAIVNKFSYFVKSNS